MLGVGKPCLELVNGHVTASTDNLRQALLAWAPHRHVTTRGPLRWGRRWHAAAKRRRPRHWRGDWRRRGLFRPSLRLHPADVVTCCVPFQIVRTSDVVGQTLPDMFQRRLVVALGVDELNDSIPAGSGCTVRPSEWAKGLHISPLRHHGLCWAQEL